MEKKRMTYKIIFNEKEEIKELKNEKTIKDILKELEVSPQTVVIKKNNNIVDENTKIENNDTIKIIQIIYGG